MITVNYVSLKIKKDMILQDINVEFDDGKIHGIIGRNGSGKTMLMKCICGFIKPTEGEITESVGVIIETPEFIPYYTGFKNLKLLADIRHKITDDDIRKSIELVGLDPKLKKSVKKYSLGMRQRLGLAQAIMEDPDLLILDEPMNGLDKDSVSEMRKYLLDLKAQGKTILIASHSAEDIDVLCDSVVEMDKGRMKRVR